MEPGDRLAVTYQAAVTATGDGHASTAGTFSNCRWLLLGGRERLRSDMADAPVEATASVLCDDMNGRHAELRFPLGDLREDSSLGARDVEVAVSLSSTTTSCTGKITAHLELAASTRRGEAAPPPSYVTSDFQRDLVIKVTIDGTASDCDPGVRGNLEGALSLTATSLRESEKMVCPL